jgi:hypothetical protein
MFPTIMPWPMTLTPTNEAIRHEAVRREIVRKKNLDTEKNYHHDLGGHERCKDSITIKEV